MTLFELRIKIDDVIKITRFSQQTIYTLKAKAIKQGYDPVVSLHLTNSYLEDNPRSGRSAISSKEKEKVVFKITTDHYSQEKNTTDIVAEI